MKYYAIIVGGGAGTRMQQNIPKQFLLLNNKPVLMHTIQAFQNTIQKPEIIVVLNKAQHTYWEQLCQEHNFTVPHVLIEGGEQRFHSVRNGLMAIREDGIIAVHDAVRPLASANLITYCYDNAFLYGNAIASIKPSDSIRKVFNETSEILNRDEIALIQTPQTFQCKQLRKAYQQHYDAKFTDDASVVENAGFAINLVEGERCNFKITFKEDLELANFIMHKNENL
jgi:2-C-methyl-D-erythritol 4-phosphate cytidylyltransferase